VTFIFSNAAVKDSSPLAKPVNHVNSARTMSKNARRRNGEAISDQAQIVGVVAMFRLRQMLGSTVYMWSCPLVAFANRRNRAAGDSTNQTSLDLNETNLENARVVLIRNYKGQIAILHKNVRSRSKSGAGDWYRSEHNAHGERRLSGKARQSACYAYFDADGHFRKRHSISTWQS
jgi:hypothetical protein